MDRLENPFAVQTPETLNAKQVADLFVDVYSDFPKIKENCHTFIHGTRGIGKSMMLRYLEPDVQIEENKCHITDLNHYAIHVSIKKTNFPILELSRLEGAPYWIFSEHYLILYITTIVFKSIEFLVKNFCSNSEDAGKNNELQNIVKLFQQHDLNIPHCKKSVNIEIVENILSTLVEQSRVANKYLQDIAFSQTLLPYKGCLLSYTDFLIPLINCIRSLSFSPKGPVFLLLDDADNLDVGSQQILNTWVSQRTTDSLCLKISTQLRYQTYRTTQGLLIESPHDFSEVDIKSTYTREHSSSYPKYIRKIVKKRLILYGYGDIDPLDFFPTNPHQDTTLSNISKSLKEQWVKGEGRGSRKSDDVTRYKTSEYMKSLHTHQKNTYMYSYAGFQTLVDISSGAVRNFLEPASQMISALLSSGELLKPTDVAQIPHELQDKIIKGWSQEFFVDHYGHLKSTEEAHNADEGTTFSDKLLNLILGIGELFQTKFLSDDSERRFISFMITKPPTGELEKILKLGIEWGYFHPSTISSKEGIGRNFVYTLNRRLAPYFKIDPSGYAAYLSVTQDLLNVAMEDPKRFVRERLKVEDHTQDDLFQNS